MKKLLPLLLLASCTLETYSTKSGDNYTKFSLLENTHTEGAQIGTFTTFKVGKDQATGISRIGSFFVAKEILGGLLDAFKAPKPLEDKSSFSGQGVEAGTQKVQFVHEQNLKKVDASN